MISFAHIANPVKVNKDSDLFIAQPITFETMKIAKDFCRSEISVELFSAQYKEDMDWVPAWLSPTPNLERSVLDFGNFVIKRKLPLLKDILERLYQNSTGQYLIYTNVDISLQPNFYLALSEIIERGYDAFMVNRRTIPSHYSKISKLPLMFKEKGKGHPGIDCFVFNRELFPSFDLGASCIGAVYIGLIVALNCAAYGRNFKIFQDLHLTFHIGDDRAWKNTPNYSLHNRAILLNLYNQLKQQGLAGRIHKLIGKAIDLPALGLQ